MNKGRDERGFTLIEVIVAIAVVAILAGVVTPSVIKHLDDSKRARALNDCQVIGAALSSFYKDTGRMPTMNAAGTTGITLLVSDGTAPTGTAGWITATTAATADLMANHMSSNTPKSQSTNIYPTTTSAPGSELVWRGPYQTSFPPDPWGRRYAANIGNFTLTTATLSNAVWVLSAGPDGIVQTSINPNAPAAGATVTALGDDIVYRIR